jgi:hypothetical protein
MGLLTGKTDATTIPSYNAKSEDWIVWYDSLKSNFGKKIANQLWLKGWGIRGNNTANDRTLREYMRKNGINITEGAWDKIVDLGGDVTDFVGDVFQTGKYIGYAWLLLMIGGAGLIIWNIAGKGDILAKSGKAVGIAGKTFVK